MQSTEEGLLQVDDLMQKYTHSCSWFIGPFYHLVRVFHPDYVRPLLLAPGRVTPHEFRLDYTILPLFSPAGMTNGAIRTK